MPYTLFIRDEANEDIAQAYLYYERIQEDPGERFLSEVSELYYALSDNPKYFGFIEDKKIFRDVKVKHFPYQIIYEVVANKVIIYSVFNNHQDPSKRGI